VLIKLGEAQEINPAFKNADELDPNAVEGSTAQYFKSFGEGKRIAPKAKDFLYFTAVMMHAAEASLLDDLGTFKCGTDGKPLTSYWDKGGNSWKWVCSDTNIKPLKNNNCFPPGTKILLANGSSKNIEDIQVGDEVITHKGRPRKVLETFVTEHDGELLELKIKNNISLFCTSEHPFYNVDFDNFKTQRRGLKPLTDRKRKTNGDFQPTFKFTPASNLQEGDLLTSPRIHLHKEAKDLNPNRALLLGYFAAEGSFSKKYGKRQSAVFTLGITEEAIADTIKNIFAEEFPECSVLVTPEPFRSVIRITATGQNIAEYFYHYVGEYSDRKVLHENLCFSSDENKKAFLTGWLDGDGCLSDNNKLVGITTSPDLAFQVRTILHSLGINNSLRRNLSPGKVTINKLYGEYDAKDHYRIEIYGNGWKEIGLEKTSSKYDFSSTKLCQERNSFTPDYGLHYLRKINRIPFSGKVYNFEVEEDHSYLADSIAVHNCDIFPEEELLRAHKKWVGKPLCLDHKSSSVEMVRGIIVDTYYDQKHKRVVGLCALDKKNYPDLARQVEAGYCNSVSMGTAVGRAICTDCGRVAKSEQELCGHMKSKSCYGEINVDLNPIELSIVVNGADPKAKIKHIIASQLRQAENLDAALAEKISQGKEIDDTELKELREGLQSLTDKVSSLLGDEPTDEQKLYNTTIGPTRSVSYMTSPQVEPAGTLGTVMKFPEPFPTYASQVTKHELTGLKKKMAKLQGNYQKLTNQVKESEMSQHKKAYFQGGGGVNEPEPNKQGLRYPNTIDANYIRDHEDKQMVGRPPFPGVGPIDGLYGGGQELELKNHLQRLASEIEDRKLRREAAAKQADNKQAYYQGGGGVNEPEPNKPGLRYPNTVDYEYIRDHEDKQMVGAPPFPGVGNIDGLYPGDLQLKEKLLRAELSARFIKASLPDGSADQGGSRWDVYAKSDDKDHLILSATVNEITKGNATSLFETVATRDFGKNLITQIRRDGFETTAARIKQAQPAPVQAPALGPLPGQAAGQFQPPPAPPAPAGPPVGAMPGMDPGAMVGMEGLEVIEEPLAAGVPEETIDQLASEVRGLAEQTARRASDLEEGVMALTGEAPALEEVPRAGEEEFLEAEVGLEQPTVASLQSMRKSLHHWIREGMEDGISRLNNHTKELEIAYKVARNNSSDFTPQTGRHFVGLVKEALESAHRSLESTADIQDAFKKYAHGTAGLLKRVKQAADVAEEEIQTMDKYSDERDALLIAIAAKKKKTTKKKAPSKKGKLPPWLQKDKKDLDAQEHDEDGGEDDAADGRCGDKNSAAMKLELGPDALKGAKVTTAAQLAARYDLQTKEGRAAFRSKCAQTGIKWAPILDAAHPDGSAELEFKFPHSTMKGVMNDIRETHKRMMDVVETEPKYDRDSAHDEGGDRNTVYAASDARDIHKMVSEGRLDASEVDGLAAFGVDQEAINYYKNYWAEAGDSEATEFAKQLVENYTSDKTAQDNQATEARLKRAYDLAYEMRDKSIIDKEQIPNQVKEILSWNDEGYESVKKIVAKQSTGQTKNAMPQVGFMDSEKLMLPTQEAPQTSDLKDLLSQCFANRRY